MLLHPREPLLCLARGRLGRLARGRLEREVLRHLALRAALVLGALPLALELRFTLRQLGEQLLRALLRLACRLLCASPLLGVVPRGTPADDRLQRGRRARLRRRVESPHRLRDDLPRRHARIGGRHRGSCQRGHLVLLVRGWRVQRRRRCEHRGCSGGGGCCCCVAARGSAAAAAAAAIAYRAQASR